MATMLAEPVIPAHVPPELVGHWPLKHGTTIDRDPFNELVPEIHKGPAIFYAPDGYPGNTGIWIVRRIELLRQIYLDTDNFSSNGFAPFAALTGGTWMASPAELDPPQHGPFRQLLNPLFTPKAMSALEGKVRDHAVRYIERFAKKGHCEFIEEFSYEFPIAVIMELIGLPIERTKEFLEWETMLLRIPSLEAKAEGTRKVVAYLTEVLEDRRRNPRNDLITWTTQAVKEGKPLTQDEQIGFLFTLFIGGLDTVSTNTGLQAWHLATHPEHQAFLRANPGEIPTAIEEFLRAYSAVTTFRICKREATVGGVTFKPGDRIAMSTTLAGRDPDEFDNPQEVRLDRRPRHVAFGFGIHTCIGMHLAKRELKIAMEEILARLPAFRLAEGHKMRFQCGVIQPESVPIVWDV